MFLPGVLLVWSARHVEGNPPAFTGWPDFFRFFAAVGILLGLGFMLFFIDSKDKKR